MLLFYDYYDEKDDVDAYVLSNIIIILILDVIIFYLLRQLTYYKFYYLLGRDLLN